MIGEIMSDSKTLKTGLLQGSLVGFFAFPSYATPLYEFARRHSTQIHLYTNDT